VIAFFFTLANLFPYFFCSLQNAESLKMTSQFGAS
jgi:hypothetical protein